MIRKWFNQFTKAAILYVDNAQLILCLPNGIQKEGQEIEDLSPLEKQPILLVINPTQFLQVHHQLKHLYLTTWQQKMLHQLLNSSCVIRSIIFLPNLLECKEKFDIPRIIDFCEKKYIKIHDEGMVFWKQLQQHNHLQQMREVSLYLRRYQVNFKEIEETQLGVITQINYADLKTTALYKPTCSLQSEGFPLVEKLLLKRQYSRRYVGIIAACLAISSTSIVAGLFFLCLGVQTFFNHNPWKLIQPIRVLSTEERSKFLQFKRFLIFHAKSALFSSQSLQKLFQQFSGKIVATDLVWENQQWTISFIFNPAFIAQIPDVKEWIGQHLKNSKLSESESNVHQYILQFE